jgi:hypothetical protein
MVLILTSPGAVARWRRALEALFHPVHCGGGAVLGCRQMAYACSATNRTEFPARQSPSA